MPPSNHGGHVLRAERKQKLKYNAKRKKKSTNEEGPDRPGKTRQDRERPADATSKTAAARQQHREGRKDHRGARSVCNLDRKDAGHRRWQLGRWKKKNRVVSPQTQSTSSTSFVESPPLHASLSAPRPWQIDNTKGALSPFLLVCFLSDLLHLHPLLRSWSVRVEPVHHEVRPLPHCCLGLFGRQCRCFVQCRQLPACSSGYPDAGPPAGRPVLLCCVHGRLRPRSHPHLCRGRVCGQPGRPLVGASVQRLCLHRRCRHHPDLGHQHGCAYHHGRPHQRAYHA